MRKFNFHWVNSNGVYKCTVVYADTLLNAVKELAKYTDDLVRIVDVDFL